MFQHLSYRVKENIKFNILPKLSKLIISSSTFAARRNLSKSKPLRILVDNSVRGHGVTHETVWVSGGQQMWGDHPIETGYSARIPVHSKLDNRDVARNVRYLPGIVKLYATRHIELYDSTVLLAERLGHPSGRYSGYGWLDYSLFSEITTPLIDGHQKKFERLLPFCAKDLIDENNEHFILLNNSLQGKKNNQDVWHLVTAEKYEVDVFLTMDLKLVRQLYHNRKKAPVASLRVQVMTPEDFGKKFGLIPVSPKVQSYDDASFFVRPDLSQTDSKRQRPSQSGD